MNQVLLRTDNNSWNYLTVPILTCLDFAYTEQNIGLDLTSIMMRKRWLDKSRIANSSAIVGKTTSKDYSETQA